MVAWTYSVRSKVQNKTVHPEDRPCQKLLFSRGTGRQMCLSGGTCPYPALADALRDLASGHTQGKIVLVP
jgi:hypothetical protein